MTSENEKNRPNGILTLPNLLSLFRLFLIPPILWLYLKKGDPLGTLFLLILSGITDVADGVIARKWNMISDFGKAFDPVADKLTQAAVLLGLVSRFPHMIFPLVLLAVKETVSGVMALCSIRRTGNVKGALWHGKLTTALLYLTMGIHVLWSGIPRDLSLILTGICMAMMAVSFLLYITRHVKEIKNSAVPDAKL